MTTVRRIACAFGLALFASQAVAADELSAEIDRLAKQVEPKVIQWRRDIHQHPELSNREFRTAKVVSEHLTALGLEVKTGVAHTGVVAILRGGQPGPVVALRADMDALPVTEQTDLPFASTAKGVYEDKEVGVMHACGHDAHVAILMGVAEMLSAIKDRLPGTVKFIFQPAEEGPPRGEEGGAALMIKQGVLEDPKPAAIFGLHVWAALHAGKIAYRSGPIMASVDILRIKVKGRQTHGSAPWGGVDPIVAAAQIVMGLQTIVSRQLNITKEAAVVSIGSIHGGNRFNIIPDEVDLVGTVRTLDEGMRDDVHRRVRQIAEMIAKSAGASADVQIEKPVPVTVNHPELTAKMLPTLKRVAGEKNVELGPKVLGGEDFSYYQQQVPGLFFFVGVTPPGTDLAKVAYNHSPLFMIDESALPLGTRALAHIAVDFLRGGN